MPKGPASIYEQGPRQLLKESPRESDIAADHGVVCDLKNAGVYVEGTAMKACNANRWFRSRRILLFAKSANMPKETS